MNRNPQFSTSENADGLQNKQNNQCTASGIMCGTCQSIPMYPLQCSGCSAIYCSECYEAWGKHADCQQEWTKPNYKQLKDSAERNALSQKELKVNKSTPSSFTTNSIAQQKTSAEDEKVKEMERGQKQSLPEHAQSTKISDANRSGCRELFVANLSYDITEEKLYEFFGKYGSLANVRVLRTAQGHSKGIAFVEFTSSEDALAALASDGSQLEGRLLRVKPSWEKPQAAPTGNSSHGAFLDEAQQNSNNASGNDSATIFAGNLSFSTTSDSLREFFSQVGEVKDIRLIMNEDGKFRGFAYIEFVSESSVEAATGLDGQILQGRSLKVERGKRSKVSSGSWLFNDTGPSIFNNSEDRDGFEGKPIDCEN